MAAESGVCLLQLKNEEGDSSSGCWEEKRPSPQFQGLCGPDDNLLCFSLKFITFMCMWFIYVYVHECMYTSVIGGQKRVLDPWELELDSCELPEDVVNQTLTTEGAGS